MKNVLIVGLGMAILVVCRYQELGAPLYMLGGLIVLLAMSDIAMWRLGDRTAENLEASKTKKSVPVGAGHGQTL